MTTNQQPQRNAAFIFLIGFGSIIFLVLAVAITAYISAANRGNAMEQGIKATWENNQNILAQYGQKVLEASQVPDMARDDISRVTRDAIEGRYGPDGSKAIVQAIAEQNPQVDASIYRNIQQIIEGGRNEFQTGQTRLIDQKRAYETALGTLWGGMWMRVAGYPKLDLANYKSITTDRASSAFSTGKESPLQLRQPSTK